MNNEIIVIILRRRIKKKDMEEMGLDLRDLISYLVELFLVTGKKYTCTRTKIGKLLSILSFKYACHNKILFNEKILKYNSCGTTINELFFYVDRDVYFSDEYYDNSSKISLPDDLSEIDSNFILESSIKEEIKKLFVEFGAYDPFELGKLISSFISNYDLIIDNNEIDLSKLPTLYNNKFKVDIQGDDCSVLINYLMSTSN